MAVTWRIGLLVLRANSRADQPIPVVRFRPIADTGVDRELPRPCCDQLVNPGDHLITQIDSPVHLPPGDKTIEADQPEQ